MTERRRVTQKAAKPAAATGRPSAYEPRFAKMAYQAALLGAKDAELARLFDVADSTLALWKTKHPEFSEALKQGKDEADAVIAKSLYHRAKGYSHRAVKIFCSKDGDVTQVPYIERYPPDTTAGIFWLKNRKPEQWRDKFEFTANYTAEQLRAMPPAEFQALVAKVRDKMAGAR